MLVFSKYINTLNLDFILSLQYLFYTALLKCIFLLTHRYNTSFKKLRRNLFFIMYSSNLALLGSLLVKI